MWNCGPFCGHLWQISVFESEFCSILGFLFCNFLLHKLTSDLIFICINWFAGNLAEIAEEDEANFHQFSYTPENGESLKS